MKTETKFSIIFFAGLLMCLALVCRFTPTKEQADISIMVHSADSVETISGKMVGEGFIISHHYDFVYNQNGETAWCNKYKRKWYSNYPYRYNMRDSSVYKNDKFIYSFSQTEFQQRIDDTSQLMHSEIKVQELGETYLYYRMIEQNNKY